MATGRAYPNGTARWPDSTRRGADDVLRDVRRPTVERSATGPRHARHVERHRPLSGMQHAGSLLAAGERSGGLLSHLAVTGSRIRLDRHSTGTWRASLVRALEVRRCRGEPPSTCRCGLIGAARRRAAARRGPARRDAPSCWKRIGTRVHRYGSTWLVTCTTPSRMLSGTPWRSEATCGLVSWDGCRGLKPDQAVLSHRQPHAHRYRPPRCMCDLRTSDEKWSAKSWRSWPAEPSSARTVIDFHPGD